MPYFLDWRKKVMGLIWTIIGLCGVPIIMTIDNGGDTRIRVVRRIGAGYWAKCMGGNQTLLQNDGTFYNGGYMKNWKWIANPVGGLQDMDGNATVRVYSQEECMEKEAL
jgi:1,4-dihydroxy-2-naphthoyl-CoA synthase